MEVKEKVMYLGDVLNTRGNNNDLIEDRVKKGKEVIVKAMSICDISLGCHTIEILMLLYQSLFLSVVLYNCQSWTKLNINDLHRLTTIQIKYLKRSLQVPRSTGDAVCFMELGIIPITFEIDIRRLIFLQHIIQMENDDPVKLVYKQQRQYPNEENWNNEMKQKLLLYNIIYTEEDIEGMSKYKWKKRGKRKS